jgi:L-alanine-DL-glutamate epimerase-like enolase superfamily enzyme
MSHFRPDGKRNISSIILKIDTDEGITGTARISKDCAETINTTVGKWLLRRDPLDIDGIWDFVFRLTKGFDMTTVSAVDMALWDIRGQAEGVPVYEILGGPRKDSIEVYGGNVGHVNPFTEPDEARRNARDIVAAGFNAQKWYFPYSTGHGERALEYNLQVAELLRETVGNDIDLMFDVHQGWPADFAVEMAVRLDPYRLRWLEEPVMMTDIDGYVRVREATSIPIAGSESVKWLWHVKTLLDRDAVDIVQVNEFGIGGVTGLVRTAELAREYGKRFIVHCGGQPTLHVTASLPATLNPLYEYLVRWYDYGQWFNARKTSYEGTGALSLPEGPGLGFELDESKVEKTEFIQ